MAAALVLPAAVLPMAAAQQGLPDFTSLAENSADAVVSVRVYNDKRRGDNSRRSPDLFFPFPFERRRRPERRESQGSGFIIDREGYVLTNAHVIAGMTRIVVALDGDEEYTAEVVGSDTRTDIALLKIDAGKPLPSVKIGDSDKVKVGQWVAAIGSPYGLHRTVTAGIISALRRRLPNDAYVPFIQTDAAVNPGNSGGPLMDLAGNVIGINAQIISPSGGFVGASFAIPINVAMNIQARLREDGEIRRGWLGVYFSPVSPATAEAHGLENGKTGVLVNEVVKNSPAENAGLHNGDIILQINGEAVTADSLPLFIGKLPPGAEVSLSVWRDGEKIEMRAILELLGAETQVFLGMKVENLNEAEKARTGLQFGVIVREVSVEDDVPEDVRQIRPGDIITHMLVNERRREIRSKKDFADALDENRKSAEVFYIWREGRYFTITVRK